MTDHPDLTAALPCEDPEEPCDQDGRDEHRWCDYCIARSVVGRHIVAVQAALATPSDGLREAVIGAALDWTDEPPDGPLTRAGDALVQSVAALRATDVPSWREASRRLHASGDDEPYATDVHSEPGEAHHHTADYWHSHPVDDIGDHAVEWEKGHPGVPDPRATDAPSDGLRSAALAVAEGLEADPHLMASPDALAHWARVLRTALATAALDPRSSTEGGEG